MATPTATVTPSPSPSPTSTPIARCGPGYCLVLTPSPTGSSTAGRTTTGTGQGPSCDLIHPGTWIPCFIAGFIAVASSWVADLISAADTTNIWTYTDPTLTYANPVVERYWDGIRLMADALLGLLVLAVAGEILLGVRLGQTYAGSLERFWRLLLVAALANGSLAMIGQAVDLSNLALQGLDAIQQWPLLALWGHGGTDSANAVLLEALLSLIDGLMELLLLLVMLMRLALLDVLIILAPPALLCYAWPRVQHWAQLWSRLFVATLLTQFVQIAALRLGEDLALNAPLILLPAAPSQTVRLWMQDLIAIGIFVVVLRVPRLLNHHAGQAVTPLAVALWATRIFATGGASTAAAASPRPSAPSGAPAATTAVSAPPGGGPTVPPAAPGGAP
jgi:hypothetical protein